MNSDRKALKEASTREGFEDYCKGVPIDCNPYSRATDPFDWWRQGWANAQAYAKPKH